MNRSLSPRSPLRAAVLLIILGHNIVLAQRPAAPAAPVPGAVSPKSEVTAPGEIQQLEKHHRSHLRLERQNLSVDVYLTADEEKAVVLDTTFCGGDAGATQFSGHYRLVSVRNHVVVSRLELDPDVNFVEKKPHDGIRLYREPATGQNLVALFQYGDCNSETVQFFAADPSAQLYAVPFLDKDGRTGKHMVTGSDGAIRHLADGSSIFCFYSRDTACYYCAAYVFDSANFQEIAKWMTQDLREPQEGLSPVSQARRSVFDFLSDLSLGNYQMAGYYFAGTVGSTPEKPEALEAYCTTQGGQCLAPAQIESKPAVEAKDSMLFQVSFQTAEFKPFRIGARSTFDFHVAKVAGEFKVLDLPPRLP